MQLEPISTVLYILMQLMITNNYAYVLKLISDYTEWAIYTDHQASVVYWSCADTSEILFWRGS